LYCGCGNIKAGHKSTLVASTKQRPGERLMLIPFVVIANAPSRRPFGISDGTIHLIGMPLNDLMID
jgi:hypothetical protein